MHKTIFVFAFIATICLITCEDQCGPPPELNRARISVPSDSGYDLRSTVTYKCDPGFLTGGTQKTSRCVLDPETNKPVWTESEITCVPRSCGDPGFIENGRRKGSRFTFPNSVEYVCDEGYRLSGTSRRYCEASGTWSGRIPSCNVISCTRPSDPVNGRAIYTSREYDSVLKYECNPGLQSSSDEPRRCGPDGEWTGDEPVCKEIECPLPEKPDFGSMELVGGRPRIGSIVIYSCDPGRNLVGYGSSKCGKVGEIGEWIYPAPVCVEPCKVPSISNGDMGIYEEYRRGYRRSKSFKEVTVGSTLDENVQLVLKCSRDYVVAGKEENEVTITCLGGQLTPKPECISTSCLGDPPPIQNGKAQVASTRNGHTIWYKCDSGFVKTASGNVKCVYGIWTGETPKCGDTRCHKESLNYPGLIRGEGFLYDGESFLPTCGPGYEVTANSYPNIFCSNGEWQGNLPPCTIARCNTAALLGFSGIVIEGQQRTLDEGEWLQPMCAAGFEFTSKNDSRLFCTEGKWAGNFPPCTPAHCFNDPPVPENGRIKSFTARGHGSKIEYECEESYVLHSGSGVACAYGIWSGSPPICKDSRCYRRNLQEKEGVDLKDEGPVPPNHIANITCNKGYSLKYPNVRCENGEWRTENLLSPCQEDQCTVHYVGNGEIVEETTEDVRNLVGWKTGTRTVYKSVVLGSSKSSGTSLYVKCLNGYKLQGEELVEVVCRRGQWIPYPRCQLPNEQKGTGVSDLRVEKVSVPPTIHTSSEAPRIVGVQDSTTASLGNNDATEYEEKSSTSETVPPPCLCKYLVRNNNVLKAYEGKKLLTYGDEIPSGSTVVFNCAHVGSHRLHGRTEITCPSDCNWYSEIFPSCFEANRNDVIVGYHSRSEQNMKIGPRGVITIVPGTDITLTCRIKVGRDVYVDWIVPEISSGTAQATRANGVYTKHYILRAVTPHDSGRYTCLANTGASHNIQIKVADVRCPKIEEIGELVVSYSDENRPFQSRATFHCFSPNKRDGPSYVTCEASGLWSEPPPSCLPETCSIGSLYDHVPEGVVPHLEENVNDIVPYGYVLKLFCEAAGRALKGGSTATCSTDGKWDTGVKPQCVQGCAKLEKKDGSELIITPNKEYYSMGDYIVFSCPPGKTLTKDVERILCFSRGWTPPDIPDCQ